MKRVIAVAALLGILSIGALVVWYGFDSVADAVKLAGWWGLVAMIVYHAIPLALCGFAWRFLFDTPTAGPFAFVWFRWMRDAGSDLLALVPGTGEMLGIRAMRLSGIAMKTATASTVVDITVEMGAQIAFTILGLAVLLDRPASPLVPWTLVGLAVVGPLVGSLFFAQRLGLIGLLERFADRLAVDFGWTALSSAVGLEECVRQIYRNGKAIAAAAATHFLAWLVGVGEAAIGLGLMGVHPGWGTLVVLESLTFALRSAAFFVPAAAGVQEGGYVVIGGMLGIGPDIALALSLLKRGRELVVGATALLLWHSLESRRLWRSARVDAALAPARINEASRDSR
jgi:putative membrane protein